MTAHVPLHFARTTDRSVHDDLLLKLGAWRHVCDSYYVAIDESLEAGADIASGLVRLLDQWLEQLERLPLVGRPVFLPFDFSDQFTGWLRVSSLSGSRVVVEAGWSAVEGWSFCPSDIADTADRLSDFEPVNNASIECELGDLVMAIGGNRTEIKTSESQADGAT
jgi:hypothetical protein